MKNIKILVKGYLKNITENEIFYIETKGIYNKNKIAFQYDSTKYTIKLNKNSILFSRESEEFIHNILFEANHSNITTYYIKETGITLELEISTIDINFSNKEIDIKYRINDTLVDYQIKIEMSEII